LREVTFSLGLGETLLLLGPSGSGKSTLALALNGLIPNGIAAEMSGQVLIAGRDTREMPAGEAAARVGVVFQDPEAQFCMLTVEDEVAFGLENLQTPRAAMEARIDEALAQVGLSGARNRRVDRLSGGEKQRLALACILAMRPPVIVLDEPTANLDPLSTREFFEIVAALRAAHAFVLIEHKLDECAALATRALLLRQDGSMLADGPPRRVFRDFAGELDEHGIWIPRVTELALAQGWQGELPLTVQEARQAGMEIGPLPRGASGPASNIAADAGERLQAPLYPPALEINGLSYAYPGRPPALRDIHLTVAAGDFTALVGPNGSGKSTLAALATGVRLPPRGAVRLFGQDLRSLTAAEVAERAGYVFQNPEHQFVADTVADELAYSLRARRRPEADVQRVVAGLVERFGLAGLESANPFTLSHGQKRRLSVATMLAAGQQMLALDEPTFGQDRRGSRALMGLLADLNRQGVTVLMITHDMRLVAEHARSVVVLVEGRVTFTGTPAELFADAACMAQARLLPPL
jgi:energy-coupling factor transport system ATP-binding protein